MKSWLIEFYKQLSGKSPIGGRLDSLSIDARVEVLRVIGLLREFGILLEMPHIKPI